MNTTNLVQALEAITLTHYSIARLVQHAFGGTYRFQETSSGEEWCMLENGCWYHGRAVYHALRSGISSELAPFIHGHVSYLIRNSDDEELLERLQILERMLLDAPQKDWILKECESVMFWDVAEPHTSPQHATFYI